jgi:hypothetical protein
MTTTTRREGFVPARLNRNPYDRRRPRVGRPTDGMADGQLAAVAHGHAYTDAPRALAIEDLEMLAISARTRGEQAATERLMRSHDADLMAARRQAWDEGRQQGEEDGRFALLEAIDHEVGGEVRDLHRLAVAIVDARERKTKADREQTSVAALPQFADAVATVTDTLIYKHHNGFVGEIDS